MPLSRQLCAISASPRRCRNEPRPGAHRLSDPLATSLLRLFQQFFRHFHSNLSRCLHSASAAPYSIPWLGMVYYEQILARQEQGVADSRGVKESFPSFRAESTERGISLPQWQGQ
jgi:hypothetical protein